MSKNRRKNELIKYKAIWLTKETHNLLRKKKRQTIKNEEGMSMMRIINNLIIKYIEK